MNASSPYFDLACVVVGGMTLLGVGLLFVRAAKIERRNLVAGFTLGASLLAILLLANAAHEGQQGNPDIGWSAMALSVFGFLAGWALDLLLGGRRRLRRDEATLGADLAD